LTCVCLCKGSCRVREKGRDAVVKQLLNWRFAVKCRKRGKRDRLCKESNAKSNIELTVKSTVEWTARAEVKGNAIAIAWDAMQ